MWDQAWASAVGAVVGAVVGGVAALWAASRTVKGQERHARQERLEGALAELILAVAELYDQAGDGKKGGRVPEHARVRLLLLTGDEELDQRITLMCHRWLRRWQLLHENLRWADEMREIHGDASDSEVQERRGAAQVLGTLPAELLKRLRRLCSAEPEDVKATVRALDEWRGMLEKWELKWRHDALVWEAARGVPLGRPIEALEREWKLQPSDVEALYRARELRRKEPDLNEQERQELERLEARQRRDLMNEWELERGLTPKEREEWHELDKKAKQQG